MKATRGLRIPSILAATALLVLTGACSERRAIPPPRPAPAPRPAPPAPLPPQTRLDWRDAPITPGDWRWSMEGRNSIARFAGGALVLSCDTGARTVTLSRAGGPGQGLVPLTLVTSNGNRQLSATAQPGPPPTLSVTFSGQDRSLDALAFSRGRFSVETVGLPTLYVPSWPEISRVVEDCR